MNFYDSGDWGGGGGGGGVDIDIIQFNCNSLTYHNIPLYYSKLWSLICAKIPTVIYRIPSL